MKKRIISLGLLATVLSFTSCVKDNESDSVVAQRQAQTEKLKAEANRTLADAEISKAKAKLEESKIAYQQALAKSQEISNEIQQLKLEVEKSGHSEAVEAQLNSKKEELLNSQYQLKQAEQTNWKNLELLKATILEDKQAVELKLASVKDELVAEKAEKVKGAYSNYIKALNEVVAEKENVIAEKVNIAQAENTFSNTENQKERLVLAKKVQIAGAERLLEIIKETAKNAQDPVALRIEKVNALEKKNKAEAVVNAKESAFKDLDKKATDASMNLLSKLRKTDFYKASETLKNKGIVSKFVGTDSKEEAVKRANYVVKKDVYFVVIPSFDSNEYDLVVDNAVDKTKIDQLKKDYEKAQQDLKSAAKNLADKKAEYDKTPASDPTKASKKAAWVTATGNYKKANTNVQTIAKDLKKASDAAKDLQEAKENFFSDAKRAEATKLVDDLNKLEASKAEAELDKEEATTKFNEASDAYNVIVNLEKSTLVGVSNRLKAQEDVIKTFKDQLAALERATSEKALEEAKNKLKEAEEEVLILEKKAEALKKAYEALLATL